MESKQRWQDWINLLLGLWLCVAPFFGLGMLNDTAAGNSYIFGAIIALLAAAALWRPQSWEEWTNLLIGLWLIAAPFVLGFTTQTAAMWNQIIVGLVVGGDSSGGGSLVGFPGLEHDLASRVCRPGQHPTHVLSGQTILAVA